MTRSAPRSIEQYLRQLREELAGEDTALIQDALYDAEEYPPLDDCRGTSPIQARRQIPNAGYRF